MELWKIIVIVILGTLSLISAILLLMMMWFEIYKWKQIKEYWRKKHESHRKNKNKKIS